MKKGINLAKKKNLEKRSSSSLDQTYSDLTPAESAHTHTHTPGFWIYMYLEAPLASFPLLLLLYLQQKQVGSSFIPKELYSVTRKKFGRSPKIYDSLFLLLLTLSLCCCFCFPLSSNKNGNFGHDHEQDDDAFFLLRNDAPL